MPIVVPRLARLSQLTAVQVADLDGGSLRLFKNDITPGVDTLLAALTLADFVGYTNKTITTWNAPYIDQTNRGVILAPMQTWTAGSVAFVSQTVFGAFSLTRPAPSSGRRDSIRPGNSPCPEMSSTSFPSLSMADWRSFQILFIPLTR